jgi:hypothetical protein
VLDVPDATDNESIFSDAADSVVDSVVSHSTIHSNPPPQRSSAPAHAKTAKATVTTPAHATTKAPISPEEPEARNRKSDISISEKEATAPVQSVEKKQIGTVDRVDSLRDNREVRSITINKGNASLGITVSPDSLGRGLVIRSVILNGAVARDGTLEAGDIITNVNNSDVAGLETEKARQLIRHHSFHSTKVVLLYLPSADKIAAEKSAAVNVERVPSSAGLSDAYTDATTDDERNELWSQPKTVELDRRGASSLGLSLVDYSEISHRGFDLPRGTYVKSLDPDSPAERSGLKFGDRIVGVSHSR